MLDKTGARTYLTDLSPKDKGFDAHKPVSMQTASLYKLLADEGGIGVTPTGRIIHFDRLAAKIGVCGNWLKFASSGDTLKLVDARFCKSPTCAMCQWRRSLKWRAKFFAILPEIAEQLPTHRWLFLTLTLKNCHIDDLRSTVSHMNKSFTRLSQLQIFPLEGWLKSLEVTRIWDCYHRGNYLGRHGTKWIVDWEYRNKSKLDLEPTDEVHPHFHVCGLVKASYFSHGYLSQKQWSELWQQSLRIDYTPIVNIKAVKAKKLPPRPELLDDDASNDDSGIFIAALETLKYSVKEQDLIGTYCTNDQTNALWLAAITEQLHGTKRIAYGGILKEYKKALEEVEDSDDLVHITGEDKKPLEGDIEEITVQWIQTIERYVKVIQEKSHEMSHGIKVR
jgi:plasmid rolling circle replication initiator protein Rep